MNLTPDEFWDLTPALFNALTDGYYRRRRLAREENAHWICTLVNHFPMRGKSAKTLRVEQLIGHSPEQIAAIKKKQLAARKKKDT